MSIDASSTRTRNDGRCDVAPTLVSCVAVIDRPVAIRGDPAQTCDRPYLVQLAPTAHRTARERCSYSSYFHNGMADDFHQRWPLGGTDTALVLHLVAPSSTTEDSGSCRRPWYSDVCQRARRIYAPVSCAPSSSPRTSSPTKAVPTANPSCGPRVSLSFSPLVLPTQQSRDKPNDDV